MFRIADDLHSPPTLSDGIAFRDGLDSVVCAFCLDVRTNLANDRAYVEFRKNHDRVNIGKGCHDLRPLVFRHYGPPLSFKSPDRIIGVDGHNELSTERLRAMQIAYVAHVQQIEIPVSQRDAFARTTPLFYLLEKFVSAQDFASCVQ